MPSTADLFAANPIRYAPQFGGFCALGIALGHVDPEVRPDIAWRILDGKLYLFSPPFEEDWNADPAGVVAKCQCQLARDRDQARRPMTDAALGPGLRA